MVDEELAKKAIEIRNASIAIQDLALNKDMKGLNIIDLTKETGVKTLERIILRIKDNTRASVVGGEFSWNLTTPKLKLKRREKLVATLAQ